MPSDTRRRRKRERMGEPLANKRITCMSKTKEQIHLNMSRVKNKDSQIEIKLRKELWGRGIRYRKNRSDIVGKPDIAFITKKVVVFVDGDFWHGYNWETKKAEIKSNHEFWYNKIEGNIRRDEEVNDRLKKDGWIVIRFWGSQIKSDVAGCADIIEKALQSR